MGHKARPIMVSFSPNADGKLAFVKARRKRGITPRGYVHGYDSRENGRLQEQAGTLVERTREKWRRLGQDIASFVSKHDYRNREPFTEAERASYARAFEMLAGAKSVFGNDVHARMLARPGTL